MLLLVKPSAPDALIQQLNDLQPISHARVSHGQYYVLPAPASLPFEMSAYQDHLEILPAHPDYPLIAKRAKFETVRIADCVFGGKDIHLIAGPCSIESDAQMQATGATLDKMGVRLLRGGAFKPRTSPYAFQGLGLEGIKLMRQTADKHGFGIVTELMDVRLIDAFIEAGVDAIQIGSRNMQNFDLLKAVGQTQTPVILKRGFAATIKEWLLAAEYIAAQGNSQIILCERGIRTFEPSYRNTLDITAIVAAKSETYLPVIVDPSHAAGHAAWVTPLAQAAIAAGADGILVEAHPTPSESISDKDQALSFEALQQLKTNCEAVAKAVNRRLL